MQQKIIMVQRCIVKGVSLVLYSLQAFAGNCSFWHSEFHSMQLNRIILMYLNKGLTAVLILSVSVLVGCSGTGVNTEKTPHRYSILDSLADNWISSVYSSSLLEQQGQLLTYYHNQDFEAVNRLLSFCLQIEAGDLLSDLTCRELYSVFDRGDEESEHALHTWLKADPKNYHANIAASRYYNAIGWIKRGNGFRKDTSEKQYYALKVNLIQSAEFASKAAAIYPALPWSYTQMLDAYGSMGRDFKERWENTYQISLDKAPWSYTTTRTYLGRKIPRWGGGFDEMNNTVQSLYQSIGFHKAYQPLEDYIQFQKARDMIDGYEQEKNTNGGLELLSKFIEGGIRTPRLYNLYSLALRNTQQPDEATKFSVEAYEMSPNSQVAIKNISCGTCSGLTPKQSVPYIDEYLSRYPEYYEVWFKTGERLYYAEDYKKAKKHFQKAAELEPKISLIKLKVKWSQQKLGEETFSSLSLDDHLQALVYGYPGHTVLDQLQNNLKNYLKEKASADELPQLYQRLAEFFTLERFDKQFEKNLYDLDLTKNQWTEIATFYSIYNRSAGHMNDKYKDKIKEKYKSNNPDELLTDEIESVMKKTLDQLVDQYFSLVTS